MDVGVFDRGEKTKKGEKVRKTIRPSRLSKRYLKYYVVAALTAVTVAATLMLGAMVPEGVPIGMVQMAAVGLFVLALAIAETNHFFLRYYITEASVIEERGVISRDNKTVPFSHVTETGLEVGALQRVLGLGDILIDTAGKGTTELVMRGIRHPDAIREMVEDRATAGGEGEETPRRRQAAPLTGTEQLEAELGRIERERSRLEDAYEAGEVADEDYRRRWYILEGQEREVLRQLDAADERQG